MDECIEWDKYKMKVGYGLAKVNRKTVRAHRLAYCESRGISLNDIKGKVVRHKCDNPGCVNPNHLEVGTQAENMRDRFERKRDNTARGERKVKSAKLTESKVREIRKRYKPRCQKNGQRALAKEYGVDQSQVSHIVNGRNWKHVK